MLVGMDVERYLLNSGMNIILRCLRAALRLDYLD
jgi:hypothetical protein